jgi:glutamate N-acetyltransferase/amino-acid N-acetyltransferase
MRSNTNKKNRSFTDLNGVFGSGIAAGIKVNGKPDLAYIFIPNCYGSAGVFTINAFSAAPLEVSKRALKAGVVKAVVVNAGNANAGTGKQGLKDAKETARYAAKLLKIKPREVCVSSTGVIGKLLPMNTLLKGLDLLLSKGPYLREGDSAAQAILTTDLTRKEVFASGTVAGQRVSVAGFAKGSGMIAPNMATMLGFLVTDAKVSSKVLQKLLKKAVDASFNMTSVDNDTSTNDMVLAFSTGERELKVVSKEHQVELLEILTEACKTLARKIASDGEGATKLIEVTVSGARTVSDARKIALNIANSPLVKTAIHGCDPNWGRVLAAAGKDPAAKLKPDRVDLKFAGARVMKGGAIVKHDRERIRKLMATAEVKIELGLNLGNSEATAWGCDLTRGYVDINVSYT